MGRSGKEWEGMETSWKESAEVNEILNCGRIITSLGLLPAGSLYIKYVGNENPCQFNFCPVISISH